MSLIIGIKTKDDVFLGGDSIVGYGVYSRVNKKIKKVFRKGGFIIGAVGMVKYLNILEHRFNPPKIKDENIQKYMVNDFIPELQKVLEETNSLIIKNNEVSIDSHCLVAVEDNNSLFSIGGDLGVVEWDDFATIGSPSHKAAACLELTRGLNKLPAENIGNIFRTINKIHRSIQPPYRIISFKTGEQIAR